MNAPATDRLVTRNDRLFGTFHSLKHNLAFCLVPDPQYNGGDQQPTHRVMLVLSPQRMVEAGAAWKRQITKGANAGADMFSITIDDPSFDAALNIAAFPGPEAGQWDVVWKRPRRQAPAETPGAAGNGTPPSGGGDLDDEIPF